MEQPFMYYNSWNQSCKSPFGAVTQQDHVTFSVYRKSADVTAVDIIIYTDHQPMISLPMDDHQTYLTLDYQCSYGSGVYFYLFRVQLNTEQGAKTVYYGNNSQVLGGVGQCYHHIDEVPPYQLTVVSKNDPAPRWFRKGVAYHIFVDRFYNGTADQRILNPKPNAMIYTQGADRPHYIKNEHGEIVRWDFYGGNLIGIIKKLPYLVELGVTILYLSPIFEARSNHKYDTANFRKIDPMFGDEAVFEQLVEQAKQQGIHIILDGVFNHTGYDSLYFNGEGTYDTIGATQSIDSPYYTWYRFNDYPTDYDSWWGINDLPTLNSDLPDVQDFIFNAPDSVVRQWSKKGIGGWRIDVADELSDTFLTGLRLALEESATLPPVLIGEVWEDATNKIAYGKRRAYVLGQALHGVMNYPFTQLIIGVLNRTLTVEQSVKQLMHLKENYPSAMLYSNLNNVSTHDSLRIKTALHGDTEGVRLAYCLLFMLPGVPTIYYGDEAGLSGGEDPDNRRPYPWGREDTALQSSIRTLTCLRHRSIALQQGAFVPFTVGECLGILRYSTPKEWLVMLLNPTDHVQTIHLDHLDSYGHTFTADGLERLPNNWTVPPRDVTIITSYNRKDRSYERITFK